jgi:hypothetical protein
MHRGQMLLPRPFPIQRRLTFGSDRSHLRRRRRKFILQHGLQLNRTPRGYHHVQYNVCCSSVRVPFPIHSKAPAFCRTMAVQSCTNGRPSDRHRCRKKRDSQSAHTKHRCPRYACGICIGTQRAHEFRTTKYNTYNIRHCAQLLMSKAGQIWFIEKPRARLDFRESRKRGINIVSCAEQSHNILNDASVAQLPLWSATMADITLRA